VNNKGNKMEKSYFEKVLHNLVRLEFQLQFCDDEAWDDNLAEFLGEFKTLEKAIYETYSDNFPYVLGLKE